MTLSIGRWPRSVPARAAGRSSRRSATFFTNTDCRPNSRSLRARRSTRGSSTPWGTALGSRVHEAPSLGRTRGDELVIGDVLAVEPGLYRPDIGGVRLEDLVLVTGRGAETLTHYPYELEP